MPLFDDENAKLVVESVKKSNEQEKLKRKNVHNTNQKKKSGRPPIPEEDKRKSYTITMSNKLFEQLEKYQQSYFPNESRNAVTSMLLQEILEQKGK